MFDLNEIWAYPTNTSFGLGVRADDNLGLQKLRDLKSREKNMFFSLMVKDLEMLREFAEVPADFSEDFFTEKPRTAILKPTSKLPRSEFWPSESVAFRVSTIPEISREIKFPITATSANISGEDSIYSTEKLHDIFGDKIKIFSKIKELPKVETSEIWNFTVSPKQRIR